MPNAKRVPLDERTLGDRLRTARVRADLSQERLGALAGCSAWTVHRIENGHVEEPHHKTRIILAAALGMSETDLWGES